MNIFFYILIFIMGIMFGSFYTLAVYRIPRGEDITHKHSYCPNCNHKLGFLDLIPVFSYIFLGAKCRYCKKPIRPRYFILEILSGLCFVIIAYCMKLNIQTITIWQGIEFGFIALYLTFLFVMCGIDKENKIINKQITLYGIIISIIYMAYLCIVEKANIYRYVIYTFFYIAFLTLDTINLKKYAESKYINWLMIAIIIMAIFTGEYITLGTVILAGILILINLIIEKIKSKKNKTIKKDKNNKIHISIGFYLVVSNVVILLGVLLYNRLCI